MLWTMTVLYFLMSIWFIYIKAGSMWVSTALVMSSVFYCGILTVDAIKKELMK